MVPPIPILTGAGGVWLLTSMGKEDLNPTGEFYNTETKASESNQVSSNVKLVSLCLGNKTKRSNCLYNPPTILSLISNPSLALSTIHT